VKPLQQTLPHKGRTGTVALRHEARCTCQCCPGLLSVRPMGGRCLCCCGMPHGCDWPAPRRVSSARRIAIVASATRLDSTLARSSRTRWRESWRMQRAAVLASPRANATVLAADSPPPAKEALRRMRHRRRIWQAGHDAIIGCCVPSQSDSLCVRDSQGRPSELQQARRHPISAARPL